MKKIILLVMFFSIWLWSSPDIDKFAQIFGKEIDINEESVSGYIDGNGKLWVTARKWHTKKVIFGAYVLDSETPPEYFDMRTVPYLYFWLYDKNGTEVKEGALGDSVEFITLIPVKNGGVLIIPRIQTDRGIRMAHPTSGYLSLILLDKDGAVRQREKLLQPQFMNSRVHKTLLDYEGNIYLTLVNGAELDVVKVHIDNGKIHLEEKVKWLSTTETQILDVLKNKILPHYDIESQKWRIDRHNLATSSFRKFEDFNLYPLAAYPWAKDEHEPEFQSVRLNNGNIIVTVFMKENEQPVVYQMLFDSVGTYIVPKQIGTSKPKDVRDIPDGSEMYIKRLPANWGKGRYISADVYIWGYDREDGMLYWKKYHVD